MRTKQPDPARQASPKKAPPPAPRPLHEGAAEGDLPFEADIAQVMRRLRSTLTALFVALPTPVRGGTDIQRELGITSSLAWQLHGVVNAADPLAAAAQVPGRHAAGRLLATVAKKGAPKAIIEKTAAAFESFEACVERHAGDRPTFYSMLGGLATELAAGTDLEARREAYRAMSHICGIQRAVSFHCHIMHPSDGGDRYDYVNVVGSVGFRVMRPFERLCVGRHGHIPDKAPSALPPMRPVDDPGGELAGVPLLKDFCTQPLPRFDVEIMDDLHLELYLSGQRVGRTGEMTYFFGEHRPNLIPGRQEVEFGVTELFPTAVQIHDVLLAHGVTERIMTPPTAVYGGGHREKRLQVREVNRLNVPAQSAFMGVGVEALQTTDAPCYVEMLRFICKKLGWDPEVFDAYRCRVEYPVLHSFLNVVFPHPDDPQDPPG